LAIGRDLLRFTVIDRRDVLVAKSLDLQR
jgi:hypothetical protein